MLKNNAISRAAQNVEECIRIIADRMIELRPRGEIEYYPFYKNDVFYMESSKGRMCVDLRKLYPHAKSGQFVCAETFLKASNEYEVVMRIWGDVECYCTGKKIYDSRESGEYEERDGAIVPLRVKKGNNKLLFKCRCNSEEFKFSFMVSVSKYRCWAKDYIFNSRAISPIDCFKGEDGIALSRLLDENETFDGEYVFPVPLPITTNVDFSSVYKDEEGAVAYALTYAINDGIVRIRPFSKTEIIINGKKTKETENIILKKGDQLLIKSLREQKWGFSFEKNDIIGIPFLKSSRGTGDEFLLIGTFGNKENFHVKYGPEFGINISQPYLDCNWKKTFWRLNGENQYVRIYMDACFFGQWFYALMVGQFGLLDAAEVLNDNSLKEYFYDSISVLCNYYDYCTYENEKFGAANFLANIAEKDFDNIGSMCMNFAELHKIYPSGNARHCMEKLFNIAVNNVPRLEDGTFYRPRRPWMPATMWADDTYMITPFFARMGVINGDNYYFEEVIRQFKGYHKKLHMEKEGIYSHIYFPEEGAANNVPWGRANGWILNSLSDVLRLIPKSIEGIDTLVKMFVDFSYALKKYQDSEGLWHQVLNANESYAETSATAMFLLGMCRGVNNGYLKREDFETTINKAYEGLIKNKIDSNGNILDVCRGSNCSMNPKYYMELGTIDNDDHGTGVILSAFAEYAKFLKLIK